MSEEKKFNIGDKVKIRVLKWGYESTDLKDLRKVGQEIESEITYVGDKIIVSDKEFFYSTDPTSHNYCEIIQEYLNLPETLTAIKADSTKPDFTDVPLDAMWEMSKAFTYGQKKYSKGNFKNPGMKVSRQLAAALRHIYQHLDGETVDKESNSMHLGNAMASLAMAIYNLKHHPEMDDRFPADKEKHGKN